MKEKWTRSDVIALASLVFMVVFEIVDHMGLIMDLVGPLWTVAQPFVVFALGAVFGFALSSSIRARKAASGMAVGASASAFAITKDENRPESVLADLSPAELRLLLRVYDKSQVYVGSENLAIARKLNEKGLVYRSGCQGEQGQIIQQCYIELADGMTAVMNAEAGKIRKRLGMEPRP